MRSPTQGMRRQDGEMTTHPGYATPLSGGDTVIVLGHHGDLPQFSQMFQVKNQLWYRGMKV